MKFCEEFDKFMFPDKDCYERELVYGVKYKRAIRYVNCR